MTAPLIWFSVPGAVTVELPINIVSVANLREHWAVKANRTKTHRAAVGWLLPSVLPPVPCIVLLTRIAPRQLDDDNLRSAFKALRDGIADRLGVKDNDPRVRWEYAQERGRPREYSARVTITAVAE